MSKARKHVKVTLEYGNGDKDIKEGNVLVMSTGEGDEDGVQNDVTLMGDNKHIGAAFAAMFLSWAQASGPQVFESLHKAIHVAMEHHEKQQLSPEAKKVLKSALREMLEELD